MLFVERASRRFPNAFVPIVAQFLVVGAPAKRVSTLFTGSSEAGRARAFRLKAAALLSFIWNGNCASGWPAERAVLGATLARLSTSESTTFGSFAIVNQVSAETIVTWQKSVKCNDNKGGGGERTRFWPSFLLEFTQFEEVWLDRFRKPVGRFLKNWTLLNSKNSPSCWLNYSLVKFIIIYYN